MKKFLLLIVFVFASKNLFAETGNEILDACEKAMGHSRFAEFKTCKIEATLTQMGMEIGMVIYKKGDNYRMETSFMGQEQVYVVTKDAFFQLKPSFQEMPFDQAEQITGQFSILVPNVADFRKEVQVENIEFVGNEDFNGKSSKKVKLASAEGETFLFFDATSNWVLGAKIPAAGMQLFYESPKRVKGFVYPSVIKLVQMGQTVEFVINSFEVDIELADSLFSKN